MTCFIFLKGADFGCTRILCQLNVNEWDLCFQDSLLCMSFTISKRDDGCGLPAIMQHTIRAITAWCQNPKWRFNVSTEATAFWAGAHMVISWMSHPFWAATGCRLSRHMGCYFNQQIFPKWLLQALITGKKEKQICKFNWYVGNMFMSYAKFPWNK